MFAEVMAEVMVFIILPKAFLNERKVGDQHLLTAYLPYSRLSHALISFNPYKKPLRKLLLSTIYRHEEIKAYLNNVADLVIFINIGNDRNCGPSGFTSRDLSCCLTWGSEKDAQ